MRSSHRARKDHAADAASAEAANAAWLRALRYLGYRPRSAKEVASYLTQKGYAPATCDAVIAKLRDYNYVNDENFAQSWAQSRLRSHGYGPRRIEQELRIKGVSQEIIRAALRDALAQESEGERAKQIIAKRYRDSDLNDLPTKRKAAALLARRGFSSAVIFAALKVNLDEN